MDAGLRTLPGAGWTIVLLAGYSFGYYSHESILNRQKECAVMAELQPGEMAPDFETTTDEGKTVKLSDYRGKRVVLYFYPKDDTPGCTTQACSFRDNYLDIEERNAVVLGISPDDVKSHQKFKTKYNLPFTLLVDEDHAITEQYGAWGEKTMYGNTYMGVIRSQVIIDEQGKVVAVHYNIKPDASVPEALEALAN
jgi:peroxiredoxin Q/BCP